MLQLLHQRVHTSQSELFCMCLTFLYSLITSVGFSNSSHAKIQQFENNVLSLTFQIWTPAHIYLIVWLLESHSISVGSRFPHLSNWGSYLTLSWIPWSFLTLIAYLMSTSSLLIIDITMQIFFSDCLIFCLFFEVSVDSELTEPKNKTSSKQNRVYLVSFPSPSDTRHIVTWFRILNNGKDRRKEK